MALRPTLPPATRVVRRDPAHLQVGTRPGVVVRDRPGLRTLLRLVDGVRDVETLTALAGRAAPELTDVPGVVRELCAVGALEPSAPGPARPTVLVRALDRGARGLAHTIEAAGTAAGWRDGEGPDAVLVAVSTDEPPRSALELAAVQHRAVLPVAVLGRVVRIGPTLRHGTSPCLGCLDHERAAWDPAWPAVLTQLEHSTSPATAPRWPPGLLPVVSGHVVALVAAPAAGDPDADGALVRLVGPEVTAVRAERALPHPRCACALLWAGRAG
ncbi:MAG: hypothetical protein PGN07_02360 [Aeromicrobium erythreum]